MKTQLTLLTLATTLLCGCGEEPDTPSGRSWTTNWPTDEMGMNDAGEKPPVADAADRPADVEPPMRPKVATTPAAGIFGGIPPEPAPVKTKPRNEQKQAPRVAVRKTAEKKNKREPIAVPVKKPVVPIVATGPKTKEMYGIPWHTSVEDALTSATKPGSKKPVMVFRVLGNLSGFM